MDKETLKYIITDFHEKKLPATKARSLELPILKQGDISQTNKIVSLVGVRRSGKTYLFYHTIKKLIQNGIDRKNIIYINFEDDRLFPIKLSEMDAILQAYYELYPEKIEDEKYLFFDEIQVVANWEKYLRRIHDTENAQICITGSSSKLLSRDISTSLRGRSISYELSPLSFKEYLNFKDITIKDYSQKSYAKINNQFDKYLHYGGFPEIALTDDDIIKEKILQEYVDLIQYKDMVEKYKVQNQFLLKTLLKFCLTHPANLISVNKLYNDFKSQGISLSKNTLYEYLEYMEESFIISLNPKYAKSIRKQQQNPKKIYIIDSGLMVPFQSQPRMNIGYKLENSVFTKLKQKHTEIYYYKNNYEIDFVTRTDDIFYLYNVSDNVKEIDTKNREINALMKGQKRFAKAQSFLLLNQMDSVENSAIKTIPIVDFLLS